MILTHKEILAYATSITAGSLTVEQLKEKVDNITYERVIAFIESGAASDAVQFNRDKRKFQALDVPAMMEIFKVLKVKLPENNDDGT